MTDRGETMTRQMSPVRPVQQPARSPFLHLTLGSAPVCARPVKTFTTDDSKARSPHWRCARRWADPAVDSASRLTQSSTWRSRSRGWRQEPYKTRRGDLISTWSLFSRARASPLPVAASPHALLLSLCLSSLSLSRKRRSLARSRRQSTAARRRELTSPHVRHLCDRRVIIEVTHSAVIRDSRQHCSR